MKPTYLNPSSIEIEENQEKAAQIFFEEYDFGSDYPLTDSSTGWNKDGVYWSKMVFGDTPEGDRWAGSFGIQFKNKSSNEIIDSWLEVI
jgi:hypothetical protein